MTVETVLTVETIVTVETTVTVAYGDISIVVTAVTIETAVTVVSLMLCFCTIWYNHTLRFQPPQPDSLNTPNYVLYIATN